MTAIQPPLNAVLTAFAAQPGVTPEQSVQLQQAVAAEARRFNEDAASGHLKGFALSPPGDASHLTGRYDPSTGIITMPAASFQQGNTGANHDLRDVVRTLKLSNSTIRNIKQNLFWAFFYNIMGIPVAMGVLHLFGGPLLNPMIAAAAMSFSSVSVVWNALRIKNVKL